MKLEDMEQLYDKLHHYYLHYKPKLDDLELMAYAASVMSTMDNFMDEDELYFIQSYIKRFWRSEYGSLKEFMVRVDQRVRDFIVPDEKKFDLESQREALMREIAPQLSKEQAAVLFSLFYQVMEADGFVEDRELEMINSFLRHVGLE